MSQKRERSHLWLVTSKPDLTAAEAYGKVFEVLADQHEVMELRAWELFEEVLQAGIEPSLLLADGALVQLGLAEIEEGIEALDGDLPPVRYCDSPTQREKDRVKRVLLGMEDDDE